MKVDLGLAQADAARTRRVPHIEDGDGSCLYRGVGTHTSYGALIASRHDRLFPVGGDGARRIAKVTTEEGYQIEEGFLRVKIKGRLNLLQGIIVKKADATGKLPIMLIAHGT